MTHTGCDSRLCFLAIYCSTIPLSQIGMHIGAAQVSDINGKCCHAETRSEARTETQNEIQNKSRAHAISNTE